MESSSDMKSEKGLITIRSTNDRPPPSTGDNPTSSTTAHEQVTYPTGARFWLIIFNLCAILVLVSLDGSIVATAVPSITDYFKTIADVGWYSSAFRLCICAFQFMFGKAYTLFPLKRVFLLSNAISLLGFVLCATAASSTMLVVGRAVAGLGCSGLVAGCFTILVYTMPLHRRPFFIGILCGAESIAIVSAPLLGGVLTQTLGWRWCFYITMPLAGITIALTAFCIQDREMEGPMSRLSFAQKLRQLDILSNVLLLASLTALFLALSWGGTRYAWSSGAVIAPLVVSVILMIAFMYNQYRLGDSAVLSLRIARQRTVFAGALYISCNNASLAILGYYLPTYYQVVRGYTPTHSGVMMLPIIIAGSIANLLLGWGISKTGYYAPFMLLSSFIMPVSAGLITTFTVKSSTAKLILYTAFSGFANNIGFSGPQTAPQAVLRKEDVSMGLAIVLFAQSFGPAVGMAVAQVLFADQLVTNLGGIVAGFDAGSIDSNGLQDIVSKVPIGQRFEVLLGIDKSITHTWYLAVGLACATMIGSVLIEWRSVKEVQTEDDAGV